MKVLLDTNVILDVWLAREPFWQSSAGIMSLAEEGALSAIISPTTVTTLHYLARKVHGERKTRTLTGNLLSICPVTSMSETTIRTSLESDLTDFEDAILESIAIESDCEIIITRNVKDFRNAKIPAVDPETFLKQS